MNDNIIHAEASFTTKRKFFAFYSCLPYFITNHVFDPRRRERERLIVIQFTGKDSCFRMTEYCFHRNS